MSDLLIDEAKNKLSPDALARAIMARAEAAGVSVTEWLSDEEHAAECRLGLVPVGVVRWRVPSARPE